MLSVKYGVVLGCESPTRMALTLVGWVVLTYMSIAEEITRRVDEGRLVLISAPALVRPILVTEDVWADLNGPWASEEDEIAANELSAVARYVIEGNQVVVGSHTHKTCQLKELTTHPPCVWELRSRAPAPGMRLLGAFAMTDTFIGTNLENRLILGGVGSPEFKRAIRSSRAKWRSLFGSYKPVRGVINDYISQNVTDARILE